MKMKPESPFAPTATLISHPTSRVYAVPRRYDLATLMAVCLAYSCLFGALRGLGTSPIWMAGIGGFVTTVGIAQAILFRGRNPRIASMIAGAAFTAITTSVFMLRIPPSAVDAGLLAFMLFWMSFWGAMFGYLAGAVVGGVFLIAHWLRIGSARWTNPQAGDIDRDS